MPADEDNSDFPARLQTFIADLNSIAALKILNCWTRCRTFCWTKLTPLCALEPPTAFFFLRESSRFAACQFTAEGQDGKQRRFHV